MSSHVVVYTDRVIHHGNGRPDEIWAIAIRCQCQWSENVFRRQGRDGVVESHDEMKRRAERVAWVHQATADDEPTAA